jgi:hypothetical protein
MTTRTHLDAPSLPLLPRVSIVIVMGTVGLALVAVAAASAEESTPVTTKKVTTTTRPRPPIDYQVEWIVRGPVQLSAP